MLIWAGEFHPWRLPVECLFVPNYTPGIWTHTWSLAVEEHFYIALVVLLMWLIRRRGVASLPKIIVGVCAFVLLLRCLTWLVYPQASDYIHAFPTHLRIDSLLAGVLLSYYQTFSPRCVHALVHWRWLPQASIALLAPAAFLEQSGPFLSTIGFSMVAAGFTFLVALAIQPSTKRPACWRGSVESPTASIFGMASCYLWRTGSVPESAAPLVICSVFP